MSGQHRPDAELADAQPSRPPAPAPGFPRPGAARPGDSARYRTLLALLASGLAVLPLKQLFTDSGWLLDVWLTMIVAVGPAVLLRLRRPPGALDIWPGIVLLIPWLTWRFVPDHAWARCIPTRGTWHDISTLMDQLHDTTRNGVAPIHTTIPVRLVLCALLALLAALIDLIAVVGRHGALAGVPMLVIYTVAGAVPRKPVSWVWFVIAALAFLMVLALDARDDLAAWGRRVATPGSRGERSAVSLSAQRIGVVAVIAAVLLPLLLPGQSRNLISNAFHGGGGGSGGHGANGFGAQSDGTGGISPFAALAGELRRTNPIPVADVTVHGPRPGAQPFYLRTNVLNTYDGKGWKTAGSGSTESLADTDFAVSPGSDPRAQLNTTRFTARIRIRGLNGNAPIFAVPTDIGGLNEDKTTWSRRDQVLTGESVHSGEMYEETFQQPTPDAASLQNAPATVQAALKTYLQLPSIPAFVRDLVKRLTAKSRGPYAAARAISDYFADPANGFSYSLTTKTGSSGSQLVDFLTKKEGFCQQYAAAMGVMLRVAGIPARVVLGYEHANPDADGNFTVTTSDAHAWVEAYFAGFGWIPFDPTPIAGLSSSSNDLPYAPHDYSSGSNASQGNEPSHSAQPRPSQSVSSSAAAPTAASVRPSSGVPIAMWVLIGFVVVLALLLIPAAIRLTRRRRRARSGDADELWAELSDTAVDLGYVWSPSRSPRQVANWLGRDARGSSGALQSLAVAVERRRYAGPDADPAADGDARADLTRITSELRAGRSGRARLRATFWPRSLGWSVRKRRH